ncbi:Uncharacterized protein BM_BM18071 [Brugia malayi]|uniref:DUF3719 domain-containing protein n=1 Tax=Brugia malayi TaxID=6279 RepID=A0A4E9F1B7_BRUMA|nr:Uncharacterized protein BM_BM18071 [Brugia malayi]VIO89817.1 Uncharacterized protein BM_BM18071 [Brugia malayi]
MQNYHLSNDDCKVKEHFLLRAEKSIYEGEPMSDDDVEAECRLWARTLPHLRVCGKSISKCCNDEMKLMKTNTINNNCLITNFLYDPFLDVFNMELKRKKLQSDALVNKMHEEKVKTRKHFTLPSISSGHQNRLSHLSLK